MGRYKKSQAFKDYLNDVKDIKKDEDAYKSAARIEEIRRESEMSKDQKFYLSIIKICALTVIVLSFFMLRSCGYSLF